MQRIRTMLVCGAVISDGWLVPASAASAETDVLGGTWT
jgi:hypothetical protein